MVQRLGVRDGEQRCWRRRGGGFGRKRAGFLKGLASGGFEERLALFVTSLGDFNKRRIAKE